jgi:hypothetical protein
MADSTGGAADDSKPVDGGEIDDTPATTNAGEIDDTPAPTNAGEIDDTPAATDAGEIDDTPATTDGGEIDDTPPTTDGGEIDDATPTDASRGPDGSATAAADRSTTCPSGPIQTATGPPNRSLTTAETIFLGAGLAGAAIGVSALPGGPIAVQLLLAAKQIANANGCTFAVGISGDAIGIGGASLGVGVYFGPNGEVGFYGSGALDVGFSLGVSAEASYTVIQGAPSENFFGDCYAVAATAGEFAVGGVAYLFNYNDGHFVGVTCSGGIGAGAPFGVYGQLSNTQPWVIVPPPAGTDSGGSDTGSAPSDSGS